MVRSIPRSDFCIDIFVLFLLVWVINLLSICSLVLMLNFIDFFGLWFFLLLVWFCCFGFFFFPLICSSLASALDTFPVYSC